MERPRESDEPWAESTVGYDGHQWVLRLVVRNAGQAPPDQVGEAFVRMLLSAYVVDARVSMPVGEAGESGLVPAWLAAGILDTLDPPGREQRAQTAMEAWENGRLPLPGDYLKAGGNIAENPGVARAMGAMIVRWIEVRPDRQDAFRRLFEAMAVNTAIDAGALAGVLGLESPVDLTTEWDEWMLRQRRIVHRPGFVTPMAVRTLKAQLLLYPSDFATALGVGVGAPTDIGQLLKHRKAPWLPDVAGARCAAIRMAAVGRGNDCEKVASLYCSFLEGLVDGKSERTLRGLLKSAADAMQKLENEVDTTGEDETWPEREP
jgi:hypothetical protein